MIVLAVASIALPSLAQSFPGPLDGMQEAHVVAVHDGDTIALDDGRQIRLVGIAAPKFSSGYQTNEEQPLARAAKQALRDLVLNQDVLSVPGDNPVDRHGRTLTHVVLADGRWVQGAMLANGWARVYSFADNRTLVP